MASEWQLRRDLCEAGRRMYMAGLMPGSDGNLSTMLNPDEVLISPSRLCKGYMTPDDIIKVNRRGEVLIGELPPSLETAMHLAAYEERKDICAVIHAHPPFCVAFTIAGVPFPQCVLPEVEVLFGGEIPVAPYATPGGPEVADSVRKPIRDKNIVVLSNHGALAVGVDIFQAAMRMEHAESSARILFYAKQLGGARQLPEESLAGLRATRAKLAEVERAVFCGHCQVCATGNRTAPPAAGIAALQNRGIPDEELTAVVRRAVEAALK